jgi:hypothetical protein
MGRRQEVGALERYLAAKAGEGLLVLVAPAPHHFPCPGDARISSSSSRAD